MATPSKQSKADSLKAKGFQAANTLIDEKTTYTYNVAETVAFLIGMKNAVELQLKQIQEMLDKMEED